MSEVLKSPLGKFIEYEKDELGWFSTCIFFDIQHNNRDLKLWWKSNHVRYKGYTRTLSCTSSNLEEGPRHFWKRIRVKEEDDETSRLPKRIKQEEKEIIDLTYEKDVEMIDLTKDEA